MLHRNHFKVFLLFLLYFLIIDSLEIVAPLYFKELGMTAGLIGLIFSLANILRFLTTITFLQKNISEKFNVLIVFLMIFSAMIIFIISDNMWILFLLSVLIFSTRSTFNISLNPFIMRITPTDNRGKIMGIRDIFLYGGSTLGIAIAGLLSSNSFSGLYVSFIVFSLIAILINRNIDYKLNKESIEESDSNTIGDDKNNKKYPINKKFISFLLLSFLSGISGGYLFLIPLIGKSINVSNTHILGSFAISTAIAALLSLLGGIITDRYNNRLILIIQSLFMIIIGYLFLIADSDMLYSFGILCTSLLHIFSVTFSVYFFNSFTDSEGEFYWKKMIPITLLADSIAPFLWGTVWSNFGTVYSSMGVIIINILIILVILIIFNNNESI